MQMTRSCPKLGQFRSRTASKHLFTLLCGGLVLTGCASQGPLRPPSLHLPAAARGLAATRMGDAVDLRWSNPSRTTDGLPLTGRHVPRPLTAEICREGAASTVCSPVGSVEVDSDTPATFHDILPPALTAGPARPLVYRVRILNATGKGAVATAVRTLAGAAPLPLLHLQAEPVPGGVALHWQPASQAADRVLIHVTRGEQSVTKQDGTTGQLRETTLAVEPSVTDSGGALDTGARAGTAQQYAVTRVRTLRVGTEDLTWSSIPALIKVSATAKAAPPPPPADLEAIANTLAASSIDLSWSPVPGAATYNVYRAEGPEPPRLLTTEAISGLSYSDRAVRQGSRYRYSVSAVDAQGTIGARSPEVTEALPQP